VVAVFKISSKYVGIIRSLATRRILGIPKLLKCINKAQPEQSRSRVIKKYSSGAGVILRVFLRFRFGDRKKILRDRKYFL